ncbi:MAG: ATP-binding protein [Candidatus Thiodiazotropha endolucinida]|nr:ATP-binding protein [Candidatus Thiodiazotropha endolucinida]
MYKYDQKPATVLSESATQLLTQIKESEYAVLCGRNNCGKSYFLKLITQTIGETASYLGPARYHNFNMLSPYSPQPNRRSQKYQEWLRQWRNNTQNIDNSPLNLQQAIAELSDGKREQLVEIIRDLLDSEMEILHTISNNSMSQKYVSVNGHNISYTSSGFRLIITLVTSLLNDEYDTYLIDEPELGISPEAQGMFADFLFDKETRGKYFGHIKTLVLATHSSVFLDRHNINNNYFVEKHGDQIDVVQSASVADINRIHFFLLGNRLESLYMPTAIVIVEGKCDYKYIERVLHTKYVGVKFSVIQANSDSRIREVFNVTKSLLGDIQKSPYQDRIFAIIDSIHGTGLPQQLEKMGLPANNIVVWSKNGIEHYYPTRVISELFHSDKELIINGDRVELNGLSYTKNELVQMVVPKIDANTEYNHEFEQEFLHKVEAVIT